MSGIVFWRHVWRQKADRLYTRNQLHNFGKQAANKLVYKRVGVWHLKHPMLLCQNAPYMKAQKPKLGKWLQVWSSLAFWRKTWRQKTMPDMASGYPSSEQIDAMSGIVFWRHVWRQKSVKLCTCNQLLNFGKQAFRWIMLSVGTEPKSSDNFHL